ncbi:hypothetical protein AcV5_009754 [Taiwanofungus camphoratus]|nr:hypothetical protein AcV5_009754 [Antrodia cinnamomea]
MPYRNFIKAIPKLVLTLLFLAIGLINGPERNGSTPPPTVLELCTATGSKFTQWLSSKPYYTSRGDNFKLDMVKTQNMVLVIGLMLRDLEEAQMANEVEGEPTDLPDYVLNSVLSEDMVENVLLPACNEMRLQTDQISFKAQPGKSGGPDVLPVPKKNGAGPKEGSWKRKKNELEPVEEKDEMESSSRKKGKGVPGQPKPRPANRGWRRTVA